MKVGDIVKLNEKIIPFTAYSHETYRTAVVEQIDGDTIILSRKISGSQYWNISNLTIVKRHEWRYKKPKYLPKPDSLL